MAAGSCLNAFKNCNASPSLAIVLLTISPGNSIGWFSVLVRVRLDGWPVLKTSTILSLNSVLASSNSALASGETSRLIAVLSELYSSLNLARVMFAPDSFDPLSAARSMLIACRIACASSSVTGAGGTVIFTGTPCTIVSTSLGPYRSSKAAELGASPFNCVSNLPRCPLATPAKPDRLIVASGAASKAARYAGPVTVVLVASSIALVAAANASPVSNWLTLAMPPSTLCRCAASAASAACC